MPTNSDEPLAEELLKAASDEGEHIWRMPLAAEYNEMIKSKVCT